LTTTIIIEQRINHINENSARIGE